MDCRPITIEDHETAQSWWVGREFPVIPLEVLPPTGMIIDGVCLGYLYLSNGGVAHAEWIVGNPEVKGFEMRSALLLLLKNLITLAKENDCIMVYSSVKNESLIKIMQTAGFSVGDTGMTSLSYI